MTRQTFSPQELVKLRWYCQHVWDAIALDCLENEALQERKDRDSVTMERDHVVEVVLDQFSAQLQYSVRNPVEKELIRRFSRDTPLDQMQEIAREAFQYKRYGT